MLSSNVRLIGCSSPVTLRSPPLPPPPPLFGFTITLANQPTLTDALHVQPPFSRGGNELAVCAKAKTDTRVSSSCRCLMNDTRLRCRQCDSRGPISPVRCSWDHCFLMDAPSSSWRSDTVCLYGYMVDGLRYRSYRFHDALSWWRVLQPEGVTSSILP